MRKGTWRSWIEMKRSFVAVLLFLSLVGAVKATATPPKQAHFVDELTGFWNGAIIKANSSQSFKVTFYYKESKLISFQELDEWNPAFGEFEREVSITKEGKLTGIFGLGKGEAVLDPKRLVISGRILEREPSVYFHLKKEPAPPKERFELVPLEINSGGQKLYGHLHKPLSSSLRTAVIYVGGRGCYAGATDRNLHAKLLRRYGIAVAAMQKRGTGKSSGDCKSATIDDLARDVAATAQHLRQSGFGIKNVGALGESAGGWVIARASELARLDFLISIVGPSTSVRAQQMQSMRYGSDLYGLTDKAKKNLKEYTELMFDADPTPENLSRFEVLLDGAKNEKWFELLEDTDIPKTVDSIGNLWVRRHAFDPEAAWKRFQGPALVLLGEKDWIVPKTENIAGYKAAFEGTRADKLTLILATGADHGMTMESKSIQLGSGRSYWQFFRVTPVVRVEMVRFLRKNGFTDL